MCLRQQKQSERHDLLRSPSHSVRVMMLQAAGEPLPSQLEHTLKGHDGPVLAVRFNRTGTYCLSAGRVRLKARS